MAFSANQSTIGDIHVREVAGRRDIDRFIKLPHSIYGPDDNWIAPLNFERREHISAKKNPFFEHAEVALFLAYRGATCVGRISAQVCRLHLETHNDGAGFFGFIEAIDDAAVFEALFETAGAWLRARGMKRIRGPFSFSINEESGLLIDGFDRPPFVFMGHAKPYYARHIEALGFKKAKDLVAYDYSSTFQMSKQAEMLCRRAGRVDKVRFRNVRMNDVANEVDLINDIFNDSWSENWGFVPMTRRELEEMGKNLKLLARPISIKFAELDGEAVAFGVALPNLNDMISDLNGRLLPFGWAKLLWRVKMRRPDPIRVALLGVRKKYQRGLTGSALALGIIDAIRTSHSEKGPFTAELSWILEDNGGMRRMIEMVGGRVYKTYRIYERAL